MFLKIPRILRLLNFFQLSRDNNIDLKKKSKAMEGIELTLHA